MAAWSRHPWQGHSSPVARFRATKLTATGAVHHTGSAASTVTHSWAEDARTAATTHETGTPGSALPHGFCGSSALEAGCTAAHSPGNPLAPGLSAEGSSLPVQWRSSGVSVQDVVDPFLEKNQVEGKGSAFCLCRPSLSE